MKDENSRRPGTTRSVVGRRKRADNYEIPSLKSQLPEAAMRALATPFLLSILLAPSPVAAAGDHWPIVPDRLRCEYQEDPLAIDAARPRLSWICRELGGSAGEDIFGLRQTAYEILVASSKALL